MRVLFICTYGDFAATFEKNNISILQNMGCEVHVASNFADDSKNRSVYVLKEMQVVLHHISFERNPFSRLGITNVWELNKLISKYHFDVIDCHNPVCGVFGRICGKKNHVPNIIYTAHGFHFYNSASMKNWLLYFPVEWICSWMTDVLITINTEDYERAKRHLHAKKTEYIPGIGVDIEKFADCHVDKRAKREELGIGENDFVIISVGELNANKNHEVIIKAIAQLKNLHIKYIICGQGELVEYLNQEIRQYGLDKQVMLLGYRTDIKELLSVSDLFAFPSKREGLSLALMEAIACKTPVICSRIRGNEDLVKGVLFEVSDTDAVRRLLKRIIQPDGKICHTMVEYANQNYENIQKYDKKYVSEVMGILYKSIMKE